MVFAARTSGRYTGDIASDGEKINGSIKRACKGEIRLRGDLIVIVALQGERIASCDLRKL